MKKSWQIKVLLFFLIVFILSNLESFLLKVLEFIVRIPLNFNAFMSKVLGADGWSSTVIITSSPLFLIAVFLILSIIIIGFMRVMDSFKK